MLGIIFFFFTNCQELLQCKTLNKLAVAMHFLLVFVSLLLICQPSS
jgi:hypothetical protein